MLHCVLGPLAEQLEAEDHTWVPFIKRVLEAYRDGRDDTMTQQYGPFVVQEIDVCTLEVSETLCQFLNEIAGEEVDFEMWSKEVRDE